MLGNGSPARAYHHGDLRAALLASAATLIEERGIDAFSLREVARRAGVSPAAPSHHFDDARGLLTALAAQAFRDLGDALEEGGVADDRETRILRQGIAYVGFAIARPGRFGLMWRSALLDAADPALDQASRRAFRALDKLVRGDADPAPAHDPACAPSIACWSIVQGFATLALGGAFGPGPEAARLAAERMLPAVLAYLAV